MPHGSSWKRNALVGAILSTAAVITLVLLLLSGSDDAPGRAPRVGTGVLGSAGSSGRDGAERIGDPKSADPGSEADSEALEAEPMGPPLLGGLVSGRGMPIAGASVHLVSASYVERVFLRIADLTGASGGYLFDFERVASEVRATVDAVRRSAHVAKTDEGGFYEFRGVEPHEYLVLTAADGWIFRYGDVVDLTPGETRELNQDLERGASISGRAVNARGEGVAGVRVEARVRAAGGSGVGLVIARLLEHVNGTALRGPFEATTGADGSFSIASIPPGAYALEARALSGLQVRLENVATGRADALIYLGEPAWVDGVLVDLDGAPLGGLAIELKEWGGALANPMIAAGAGPMADALNRGMGQGPRRVHTDAGGGFRIGPLGPGRYHLSLVGKGVRPLQRQFSLEWGQEMSLGAVQVDRGARVAGHVLSESGEGIEGARVTVSPVDAGVLRLNAILQDTFSGRNQVVAGPGGEFELGGLPAGQYWLSATASGWSPNGVKVEAGDDDCEIYLVPGERVTGIVTDARMGSPVRARVKGGQVETTTDADGRFVVDGVVRIDPTDPNLNPMMRATGGLAPAARARADQRVVTLTVRAEGYATTEVELNLERGVREAEVQLRPAPEIAGRVLSPEGAPVAGSVVRFVVGEDILPPDVIDPSLLMFRTAVSDAEGRYRIRGFREVGPSAPLFRLLADHPEYARGESESFRLEAGERLEVDLALGRPAIVKGVVSDGVRPVAGAGVRLAKIDKAERSPQSALMMRLFGLPRGGTVAYTDADGWFVHRRVVEGDYVIDAEVPGSVSAGEREMYVYAGQEVELELLVDPGEEIRGLVLDTEGNSLEDAVVKILREPEGAEGRDPAQVRELQKLMGVAFKTTRTDEEGVFEFRGLPEGRYTVEALKTGYVSADAVGIPAGETDVELELEPGAGLSGHVLDAATGAAVTDFSLFVLRAGKDDSRSLGSLFGRGVGREENDPRGRYSRSDLAAGRYQVTVKAAGYLPVTTTVELLAGRVLERHFELVRGASIRGIVIDGASRRPVVGASVGLKEGSPPSRTDQAGGSGRTKEETSRSGGEATGDQAPVAEWLKELWRGEKVRTDEAGRFLIESVPEGVATVAVEHNEYVPETRKLPAVSMGEELKVEIPLTRGLSLAGRAVTETGDPLASKYMFLNGASPETQGLRKSTVTSPEGAFRFTGLRPGKYRVVLPDRLQFQVGSEGASVTTGGSPGNMEIELRESRSNYLLRVPGS